MYTTLNKLRRNPLSRQWILYLDSPMDLGELINRMQENAISPAAQADAAGRCPYCAGTARQPYSVIADLNDHQFTYNPSMEHTWHVRTVPHYDPLFRIEGQLLRRGDRLYDIMEAHGAHELILLHSDHSKRFPLLDSTEITRVLVMLRKRFIDLSQDPHLGHLTFFINDALSSSAHLSHPHGQILSTPFVPQKTQSELRGANEWYRHKERCLFCDILNDELELQAAGRRSQIIAQNRNFITMVPFFGAVPFETWIIPRDHASDFKYISDDQLPALADMLYLTMRKMQTALGEVPFTLTLMTQPNKSWGIKRGYWLNIEYDWHWRFLLTPRPPLMTDLFREFFLGTGSRVNPVLPEQAAALLRGENVGV